MLAGVIIETAHCQNTDLTINLPLGSRRDDFLARHRHIFTLAATRQHQLDRRANIATNALHHLINRHISHHRVINLDDNIASFDTRLFGWAIFERPDNRRHVMPLGNFRPDTATNITRQALFKLLGFIRIHVRRVRIARRRHHTARCPTSKRLLVQLAIIVSL